MGPGSASSSGLPEALGRLPKAKAMTQWAWSMATRDGVMLKQASSMKGASWRAVCSSCSSALKRSVRVVRKSVALPWLSLLLLQPARVATRGVLNSPRVTLRLCLSITTPLLMSTAENQPVGVHTVRKKQGDKSQKGRQRGGTCSASHFPGHSQASPFDSIAWRIKKQSAGGKPACAPSLLHHQPRIWSIKASICSRPQAGFMNTAFSPAI